MLRARAQLVKVTCDTHIIVIRSETRVTHHLHTYTSTVTCDTHFVNGGAIDGPDGGGQAGWGAAPGKILGGLVREEAVKVIVRVFKRVIVDAVVGDVVSGGMSEREEGRGGGYFGCRGRALEHGLPHARRDFARDGPKAPGNLMARASARKGVQE